MEINLWILLFHHQKHKLFRLDRRPGNGLKTNPANWICDFFQTNWQCSIRHFTPSSFSFFQFTFSFFFLPLSPSISGYITQFSLSFSSQQMTWCSPSGLPTSKQDSPLLLITTSHSGPEAVSAVALREKKTLPQNLEHKLWKCVSLVSKFTTQFSTIFTETFTFKLRLFSSIITMITADLAHLIIISGF